MNKEVISLVIEIKGHLYVVVRVPLTTYLL